MSMNSEVKNLWVETLESGRFEQGTNVLATKDGKYCCLGVLCELAIEAGVLVDKTTDEHGRVYYNDGIKSEIAVPPPAVLVWAGLGAHNNNPEVRGVQVEDEDGVTTYDSLAEINDHTDAGFAGIAKIIREQL